MPKIKKTELLAALIAMSLSLPALANGGAAAAAALMNMQREEQEAQIPMPTGHNDGFVEVDGYYRDGPAFRVCPDRKGILMRVEEGQCQYRTRVRNGFMDWSDRFDSEPAVGMQEYLDEKFGDGVTEFSGVSSRLRGHRSSLVIFYRIRDMASTAPQ